MQEEHAHQKHSPETERSADVRAAESFGLEPIASSAVDVVRLILTSIAPSPPQAHGEAE